MGIQPVRDVELIRHAYTAPARQGRGIGGALLEDLLSRSTRPLLVGTWAAAEWAIRFYERHGFERVSVARKTELLARVLDDPGAAGRDVGGAGAAAAVSGANVNGGIGWE